MSEYLLIWLFGYLVGCAVWAWRASRDVHGGWGDACLRVRLTGSGGVHPRAVDGHGAMTLPANRADVFIDPGPPSSFEMLADSHFCGCHHCDNINKVFGGAALDELVRLSEEYGLYDQEDET